MALDVFKHLQVEVLRTYTHIAIFVDKYFERVEARHENPLAHIKFTLLDQERPLDIFLYNLGAHLFFVGVPIECVIEFIEAVNADATCVVRWLRNPNV